jgi:hypothetical protein
MSERDLREREVDAQARLVDALQAGFTRWPRSLLDRAWLVSLIAAHLVVGLYAAVLIYRGLTSGGVVQAWAEVAVIALVLVWAHLGHRLLRHWRIRRVISEEAQDLSSRLAALRESSAPDRRPHDRRP